MGSARTSHRWSGVRRWEPSLRRSRGRCPAALPDRRPSAPWCRTVADSLVPARRSPDRRVRPRLAALRAGVVSRAALTLRANGSGRLPVWTGGGTGCTPLLRNGRQWRGGSSGRMTASGSAAPPSTDHGIPCSPRGHRPAPCGPPRSAPSGGKLRSLVWSVWWSSWQATQALARGSGSRETGWCDTARTRAVRVPSGRRSPDGPWCMVGNRDLDRQRAGDLQLVYLMAGGAFRARRSLVVADLAARGAAETSDRCAARRCCGR